MGTLRNVDILNIIQLDMQDKYLTFTLTVIEY